MKFHKFISAILHPIVMPTIGILLYLIFVPSRLVKYQKLTLLGIVFVTTYIIPLLLLVFLKFTKSIKDFRVHSIKERRKPLLFMMILFFALGNSFSKISLTQDISCLFFGIVLGMIVVSITMFFNVKTSLHLLSMGSATGFFMLIQYFYRLNILPIIIVFIFLSGVLATSRLYLKAHTTREVYLGFFVGLSCQFLVYLMLM